MQQKWILPTLAGVLCVVPAQAIQYVDLAGAQKLIFPTASRFEKVTSGSTQTQKVWRAFHEKTPLGFFIVDEVYGKHDFITYAVGIDAQGKVVQIEIMDYREAYGSQVRGARWRRQFVGKTKSDALQLDKDILNISGATLSCRHVTEGVKRLLAQFSGEVKP